MQEEERREGDVFEVDFRDGGSEDIDQPVKQGNGHLFEIVEPQTERP